MSMLLLSGIPPKLILFLMVFDLQILEVIQQLLGVPPILRQWQQPCDRKQSGKRSGADARGEAGMIFRIFWDDI